MMVVTSFSLAFFWLSFACICMRVPPVDAFQFHSLQCVVPNGRASCRTNKQRSPSVIVGVAANDLSSPSEIKREDETDQTTTTTTIASTAVSDETKQHATAIDTRAVKNRTTETAHGDDTKSMMMLSIPQFNETSSSSANAMQAPDELLQEETTILDRLISKKWKERISKHGANVMLAYLCTSNISSVIFGNLTWYLFLTQAGTSPFAPGQWKLLAKIYSGMYVFQATVVRPFRMAGAIGLAPKVDMLLDRIQQRFRIQRRSTAMAWMVLVVNFCGTCTLLLTGMSITTWIKGIPIFRW